MSRAQATLTTYGVLKVCVWYQRLTTHHAWIGYTGGYIRPPKVQETVTHKRVGQRERVLLLSNCNDAMRLVAGVVS